MSEKNNKPTPKPKGKPKVNPKTPPLPERKNFEFPKRPPEKPKK